MALGAAALICLLLQSEDTPAAEPSAGGGADAPTCRICYAGAEAGRLFTPCLCRGSMAHVHVACLNEWRKQSLNPRSLYVCDACGYAYREQPALFNTPREGVARKPMTSVLFTLGRYPAHRGGRMAAERGVRIHLMPLAAVGLQPWVCRAALTSAGACGWRAACCCCCCSGWVRGVVADKEAR